MLPGLTGALEEPDLMPISHPKASDLNGKCLFSEDVFISNENGHLL
jgi:hypothetical protein